MEPGGRRAGRCPPVAEGQRGTRFGRETEDMAAVSRTHVEEGSERLVSSRGVRPGQPERLAYGRAEEGGPVQGSGGVVPAVW